MRNNVITRVIALGLLVLVGLMGCELLQREQPTEVTAPAEVSERSDFIMGAPEIADWGAQYAAGNTYVMVNIPVAGALQVDYGIVNGGTYALFLETRQPVGLEIGLATREVGVTTKGLVDLLEWVCVTYQVGATFASIPANGIPQPAHTGAWVQYQRQEDRVYHWWPPGAGFVFSGAPQRLCVIEEQAVAVSEVSGPFSRSTAPVASNVNISGTKEVGQTLEGTYDYSDAQGDPEGPSTYQWYRADDASGSGSAALGGATGTTYALVAADEGKYLRFEVMPVAVSGTSPGTAAQSGWSGPIVLACAAGLFRHNYDGTVTDCDTNKMWEQNANAAFISWAAADARCTALTTGGYTDWRLPKPSELKDELYDGGITCSSMGPFTNVQCHWYWGTDTDDPPYTGLSSGVAWRVDLNSGIVFVYPQDLDLAVWCVRG